MEITDVEKQLSETIEAYEKKDGATLKLLLNGIEEEYGNSGIGVLTTQDGFSEHTELSVGIAKYLIDCVKNDKTYFFHYFGNDLRELSSDIVDVYVRLLLHNEIKSIREQNKFAEPYPTEVEIFERIWEDRSPTFIWHIEQGIEEEILYDCEMLFEEEIESCDDFIIDSSLFKKISLKAKLPENWIAEYEEHLNGTSRDVFKGNPLFKRNKNKYDTYKKIAQIIHIGKKDYPNKKMSEASVCGHFDIEYKSFNRWKNENMREHSSFSQNLTKKEIIFAKEKAKIISNLNEKLKSKYR